MYGRKMLTGYLRSKGKSISENTVANVMKKLYPYHASERHSKAARNLNPKPKTSRWSEWKTSGVQSNTCDSKRWLFRNGCGSSYYANQK